MILDYLKYVVWSFEPYAFIGVMGMGIASDILFSFPYPAHWLQICSYIMFGIASLLFIALQVICVAHFFAYISRFSCREYCNFYFKNLTHNVFWGTYPMGLITLLNFLSKIAQMKQTSQTVAKQITVLVYALWWYDVFISLLVAWGVSFLIWQDYYFQEKKEDPSNFYKIVSSEHIKSKLLLVVVPLVVVASSSSLFVMTELFGKTFNRNIQLLTMVITALIWSHALIFVFILITIYFWSLYVYKLPGMDQIFTLFLVLGPLGQGSFGILLLTENIKKYVNTYYPLSTVQERTLSEFTILQIVVPWCFKVFGLLLALALLSTGYFFTMISIAAIASYLNDKTVDSNGHVRRVYHFHKGFWGMTFPMGTMSLGTNEIFVQYNRYIPMGAFRVLGTIYAVVCIVWSIFCFACSAYQFNRKYIDNKLYKNGAVPSPVDRSESAEDKVFTA